MRDKILHRLKTELPQTLKYHDANHTISVEKAAIRLSELEKLSPEDTLIIRTAILYHDAGFIYQYEENEKFAKKMVKEDLPVYGYSDDQIYRINQIIRSTEKGVPSSNLLDDIMSDSDHDYFGRDDYYKIANYLRDELLVYGREFEELEWIDFQLAYLDGRHKYLTASAQNMRNLEKAKRIDELKLKRTTL
ncbi:MAG: HD domain-containing protein [Bacteroidota bacterium]